MLLLDEFSNSLLGRIHSTHHSGVTDTSQKGIRSTGFDRSRQWLELEKDKHINIMEMRAVQKSHFWTALSVKTLSIC